MRIWTKRDGRSFCRNGGVINARLIPGYAPVYAIAALSFCGAFALSFPAASDFIFAGLWTPQYILLSPFVHSGAAHFFVKHSRFALYRRANVVAVFGGAAIFVVVCGVCIGGHCRQQFA